jgi:hypothetical protein
VTVRQGKGKKDRQIPLVEEAVKALRNYLRYRNTEWIEDDEIFFLAKNGTSLNVSSVKYLVAKYVKKAGIRKKVSVHTLRHTFGAHKADKQMGIATLQELMGHKKKETTLKYIHLAKTNLRQEMMQTALTSGDTPSPGHHPDHRHGGGIEAWLAVWARHAKMPSPAEIKASDPLRETTPHPRPQGRPRTGCCLAGLGAGTASVYPRLERRNATGNRGI